MTAHPTLSTGQAAVEVSVKPTPAAEPIASARPFWQAKSEHPRRVLVADDESLSAASVMHCLRHLGYVAVGPAHNGAHAIELAFSTLPDMALLDARMSTATDGLDAARALFSEMLLPVVIVSAYSNLQQVAVAADAGVFGYLVKPVSEDQLRPAIEVAWARFNQFMTKEIEAGALSRHLEDRRDIDQAVWALVERGNMTESDAMRELRRLANVSGQSLGNTARAVLKS